MNATEVKPETVKALAVKFFRWWWNMPGANTDQGFDEWAETPDGKAAIAALSAVPETGGGFAEGVEAAANVVRNVIAEARAQAASLKHTSPESSRRFALLEAIVDDIRALSPTPSRSPETEGMVGAILDGTAPMSKWVGSVDYHDLDGFEQYLKTQLREKLDLKISLDKKRHDSPDDESLATFVDGSTGALESALATFRFVRAALRAQPTAGEGWQGHETMWAECVDDYEESGELLWECREIDGRDTTHEATITLAANTFPKGTKIVISEPDEPAPGAGEFAATAAPGVRL